MAFCTVIGASWFLTSCSTDAPGQATTTQTTSRTTQVGSTIPQPTSGSASTNDLGTMGSAGGITAGHGGMR